MKVIEFGYAGKGSYEQLNELMQDGRVVLVDIRLSPRSKWYPQFNGGALRATYGARYLWLGETLGNKNYKPEDRAKGIELVDAEAGINRLKAGLAKGYTLIVMCACRDYQTCHRHVVCEMVGA